MTLIEKAVFAVLTRALVYIFLLINVVVLKHFPEYLFFIDIGKIQRYLLQFGVVGRISVSSVLRTHRVREDSAAANRRMRSCPTTQARRPTKGPGAVVDRGTRYQSRYGRCFNSIYLHESLG